MGEGVGVVRVRFHLCPDQVVPKIFALRLPNVMGVE